MLLTCLGIIAVTIGIPGAFIACSLECLRRREIREVNENSMILPNISELME